MNIFNSKEKHEERDTQRYIFVSGSTRFALQLQESPHVKCSSFTVFWGFFRVKGVFGLIWM